MSKYINRFLNLKCRDDLLPIDAITTTDQITELMGLYAAIRDHDFFGVPLSDSHISCLVLNEDTTPYLGAGLAFLTNWHVQSIGKFPFLLPNRYKVAHFEQFQLRGDEIFYDNPYYKRTVMMSPKAVTPDDVLPFVDATENKVDVLYLNSFRSPIVSRAYLDQDITTKNKWVNLWKDI
jgi:hypothetical protein